MPKLSVIVPVYNVKGYLSLSLQSVRHQSFEDIEIVCVNDGSTDGSGDILNVFAAIDQRIRVVEKDNGGLSSARNAGILNALGDIVCFLDSDDLLAPDACEVLARKFDETNASVVTYGGSPYPECGGYPWLNSVLSPDDKVYDPFDTRLLFSEMTSPFAWRTACRRDFLLKEGLLFDESVPYGEDQVFLFELYPRSPRTALISDKLVRYRVARPGSFMDSRRHDPYRMAKEHVNIVRHIFEDWHGLGLLETAAYPALDWTADFVLVRIFRLPEEQRRALMEEMRPVLTGNVEKDQLASYCKHGFAAHMVELILGEGAEASNASCARALYSFFLRAQGKKRTLSLACEDLARWLRGKRYSSDDGLLSADLSKEAVWDAWEKEDEQIRLDAWNSAQHEFSMLSSTRQ